MFTGLCRICMDDLATGDGLCSFCAAAKAACARDRKTTIETRRIAVQSLIMLAVIGCALAAYRHLGGN